MSAPLGPEEQAYAGLVADADAAYTAEIGRAADLLGADDDGESDARLAAFRASGAAAERAHARALTTAAGALEPALAASMREIDSLAASDRAAGTAFTAESIERHDQLVAARARLLVAAMRPGIYAHVWHDELIPASLVSSALPTPPRAEHPR